MNTTMTSYTKGRLIKELAFSAGISQVSSRKVLDAIGEIIRREMVNGPFILPGICKFDTVVRKERRMRNPRTGGMLIIPEHKVLRVTPAKVIREAVAPRVASINAPAEEIKPEVEAPVVAPASVSSPVAEVASAPVAPPVQAPVVEPSPAPIAEPAVAKEEPVVAAAVQESAVAPDVPVEPAQEKAAPVVESAPVTTKEDTGIADFVLPETETSATVATPAPKDEEFVLPEIEETPPPASVPAPEQAPIPEPVAEAEQAADLPDITFHCSKCGQEIEAPGDMAGMEAECPMCGNMLKVPAVSEGAAAAIPSAKPAQQQETVSAREAEAIDPSALKNKTIRIDATELFDEPAPAAPAVEENAGMISFFCPGCHQEIEATADMAGSISECPNCGTEFEVPFFSEKGTIHADKEELFDPRKADQQKHKTMRIDLDDF